MEITEETAKKLITATDKMADAISEFAEVSKHLLEIADYFVEELKEQKKKQSKRLDDTHNLDYLLSFPKGAMESSFSVKIRKLADEYPDADEERREELLNEILELDDEMKRVFERLKKSL